MGAAESVEPVIANRGHGAAGGQTLQNQRRFSGLHERGVGESEVVEVVE